MTNDNLDLYATREEASRKEKKVNQEIRGRMKEANENGIRDRCKDIKTGNSMAAFDTLKLLTRQQHKMTKLNENAKVQNTTKEKAIHERWTSNPRF